jgi:hypothetical protein
MNKITARTFWSAAALSILLLAPAHAQTSGFKTLVGTWRVTVSPDGIPPFQAFNTFNADGSSIEFDNSNPPGQQTIAMGPWERVGDRDYMMVEVNQLFDDHGYAGELRVRAKITLDASGDCYTGPFTFQVVDMGGNVVFQGGGTAKGRRITIDSLAGQAL